VKLVKLRRDYAARVAAVDNEIRNEQTKLDVEEREDMADEWDSRRLDAGLFCLQTIDVILAWLVAEDDGASKRIQSLLADRDESLAVVKATIQGNRLYKFPLKIGPANIFPEQLDIIVGDTEEEITTKDMLGTLVQFLT
jgi:beta-catenin-like protein 1